MTGAVQLLTVDQAMYRVGGYTSRKAFVRAMRLAGLPRVRINRRVVRFDPAAVEGWIRRRAA